MPRFAASWRWRNGKAHYRQGGDGCESVGALQLCAGHPVGVEAAIHAMRDFLDDDSSDGILLIDADNAFNRSVALWNVQFTCPAMKHVLINFYAWIQCEDFFNDCQF